MILASRLPSEDTICLRRAQAGLSREPGWPFAFFRPAGDALPPQTWQKRLQVGVRMTLASRLPFEDTVPLRSPPNRPSVGARTFRAATG